MSKSAHCGSCGALGSHYPGCYSSAKVPPPPVPKESLEPALIKALRNLARSAEKYATSPEDAAERSELLELCDIANALIGNEENL